VELAGADRTVATAGGPGTPTARCHRGERLPV